MCERDIWCGAFLLIKDSNDFADSCFILDFVMLLTFKVPSKHDNDHTNHTLDCIL